MKQAGEEIGEREQQSVVQKQLVGEQEKIEKMKEGGDLQGESLQ